MWLRAFAATAALGALILTAGCSADDSEVARLLEAADPIATHEAGVAFIAPHLEACMESLGYDGYVHRLRPESDYAAVDPTDDRVGFGISTFAVDDLRTAIEVWSLDTEEQQRWQAEQQPGFDAATWSGDQLMDAHFAEYECAQDAREAFRQSQDELVDPALLDRFNLAVAEEQRNDSAIAEGTAAWSACMADAGHEFSDVAQLADQLQADFDRNHVYSAAIGRPDVERLTRQLVATEQFREREIELGRQSDACSVELWEATSALRERVAAEVLADDQS